MIEIKFNFPQRKQEDLEQLNKILSVMPLIDLKLEDSEGYLENCAQYHTDTKIPADVVYRYGLNRGVLICEQEEEGGYYYQIETKVVERNHACVLDQFYKNWCKENPDRIMGSLTHISFEQAEVFVVFHHNMKEAII